jgi:predicted Zn-dependent peptidase
MTGDWRNIFRTLDQLKKVTAEDVMRVAATCFTRNNLTVGEIVTASSPSGSAQ